MIHDMIQYMIQKNKKSIHNTIHILTTMGPDELRSPSTTKYCILRIILPSALLEERSHGCFPQWDKDH